MKRTVFPCLLATLLAAAACQNPKIEVVNFDDFTVTSVKNGNVIESGRLSPEIQRFETLEPEGKMAETNLTDFVLTLSGTLQSNSLTHISGTYTGHDLDGSPITLSGKVLLPAKGPIKNIILVTHYTVAANFECPSESFPLEGVLASKGYAMVFPDYIETLLSPGKGSYSARMQDESNAIKSRIFLKSGSMGGVRCFSGYIVPTDGGKEDTIVFSVLVNNYSGPNWQVMGQIDKIIALIASMN